MSSSNKTRNLVDKVLIDLRRKIVEKELVYGAQLPSEFELMREYEVGRSTVREAVKILTHAGLLTIKRGKGTFVAYNEAAHSQHATETGHIAETRHILEQAVIALAAERRTAEDLEKLRFYLDRRNEALDNGDYSSYIREDLAFHLAVAEAAHNESLLSIYTDFSKLLYAHLSQFLLNTPNYRDNSDLHEKMFRAIKEQNKEEAKRWVAANIEANFEASNPPSPSDSDANGGEAE